jgi:hypothetical protein
MTAFETFLAANPTDPRVVRIVKLLDKPLGLNSKVGQLIGQLIGELMREVAA